MFPKSKTLNILALAALTLCLGACDSDSPTAPSQGPAPPPPANSSATANFSMSVNASPNEFDLDALVESGDSRSVITVRARRLDNSQPVASGSTANLSTTSGTLTSASGGATGTSIPIIFGSGGVASATLDMPIQEGSAIITARLQNSSAQTTVRVTSQETTPLFIQSISPTVGPPSGGTLVNILGTGFDEPVRVTFGGIPGVVDSVSSGRVRAFTPQVDLAVGTTNTVDVTVSVNVNDPTGTPATDTLGNAFTYARAGQIQQPRIISVTPASGPNEGGTLVSIRGEGFADEVQVFFGTSALIEANVASVTPTLIRAETPSATGPNSINQNAIVDVRVTNLASGASDTLGAAFQYGGGGSNSLFISAAGPGQGVYLGGTIAEIFGQGFVEPVAVEFGGLGQQEISVTGTEIVARSVPAEIINCNRPSGPFRVVNIETGEAADSSIEFVYIPIEPAIGSVSPNSATVDVDTRDLLDNTTTVISGSGFDRSDILPQITFGAGQDAVSAPVIDILALDTSFDPSFEIIRSLRVSIPSFFGNFAVETCALDNGESGERLLPTRVDVNIDNLPTGCTDTFINGFTYIPSDQTCQATTTGGGTELDAAFTVTSSAGSSTVTFLASNPAGAETFTWEFFPSTLMGDGIVMIVNGGLDEESVTVELLADNYNVRLTVGATGADDVQSTTAITVPCVDSACTLQ